MSLRLQLPSLSSQIHDKIYGLDYRCHNEKCCSCFNLHRLTEKICICCKRIFTIDGEEIQDNDHKSNNEINIYTTAYILYACEQCKLYKSIHEKLIKLYWMPLCWLSDGHSCSSGIDTATLLTINYINDIINKQGVKIYPKILVSNSVYNQMIKIDNEISPDHYAPIQNLIKIRNDNPEYVLFFGNLQYDKKDNSDSHQIVIVFKDNKLHIIDNECQMNIQQYIQDWRDQFGDDIWNCTKIIYYSFDINAFADYRMNKIKKIKNKYQLSFHSGLCSPNSNFHAIISASYYNKSDDIFAQLYDKSKYIHYILNDNLVTYFPQQWHRTFPMWHPCYSDQWIDYWQVLNGFMSLNEYIQEYQRMLCLFA